MKWKLEKEKELNDEKRKVISWSYRFRFETSISSAAIHCCKNVKYNVGQIVEESIDNARQDSDAATLVHAGPLTGSN